MDDDIEVEIDMTEINAMVERVTSQVADIKFEYDNDADSDVVIDESFEVSNGETLYMDVAHSDVYVETGASETARIRVMLSGTNMSRAREVFDDMEFSLRQDGDEIRLVAEDQDRSWNNNDGNIDIEIVAYIPENFDLRLKSTHGDIELQDIIGDVYLDTTHGDIDAEDIRGNALTLKSTHGDIEASTLEADDISLKTTHADIDVDVVSSNSFKASTTHSDIEIGSLSGTSSLSTSHGDIDVEMIDSNGAEFQTSHGDIMVIAPRGMKADLDIEGASVRLDKDFEFSGSIEDDEIRGDVNGGGVRFKARTTHGSVTVRSN